METSAPKDQRKSARVAVELRILGELEGLQIAMRSENISLEGMLLFSTEFVRPQASFVAKVWLGNEQVPVQLHLTSCFTERTWNGYRIGVRIAGISESDSARWWAFYRSCAATRPALLRPLAPSARTAGNQHIVIVDGALSALAAQALRNESFKITQVPSVGQAIEVLHHEQVDAVISDLHRPGLDGLALCCHISGQHLPTRTLLLTTSAVPREFLLGLYAGATRVLAKQCNNEMLVTCLREVLQQPLPGSLANPPSASAAADCPAVPSPLARRGRAAAISTDRLSPRYVAHRASQYLGQVWRYFSDLLVRPQVA